MKKIYFLILCFFVASPLLHAFPLTASKALKKDKDGFLSFDKTLSSRDVYAYELMPPMPERPMEVLIRPKASTRIRFVFEGGEVFNMHLECGSLRAKIPADKRKKIAAKNLVLPDAVINLRLEPYQHPYLPFAFVKLPELSSGS